MEEHILRVETVDKHFGEVRAVDRLSFGVRRGEIFAFLGPNGAGKTTTVRMLVGILQPDAGTIRYHLDGRESERLDPPRMGYLPEDRGLYPDVPVLRTLAYMGAIRGMDRRAAADAAMEWLERLDLADRAQEKLDALSKGNQQKVQFVAAVLHRPAFAILDEPFSGLDPLNQELFLGFLRELRDAGTTILLCAHQMQLVERVADRVLLLDRGREVLRGTVPELKGDASRISLELAGDPDPAALEGLPAVVRVERRAGGELAVELDGGGSLSAFLAAVAARHEVLAIRSEEVSLHEVFLRRVGGEAPGDATREPRR